MADSAAFKSVYLSSDHVPVAIRSNEPTAPPPGNLRRPARGRLRPSQVPARPTLATDRPPAAGRPGPSLPADAGRPLGAALRQEMEARLGAEFSQVRLHTDGAARASAAEVGAQAYTVGDHVVIGEGGADKRTLAHELTHVIQQREGPVTGTDLGNGVRISDPFDSYEKAAEANADRVALPSARPASRRAAAAGGAPRAAASRHGRGLPRRPVLQRLTKYRDTLWSEHDQYVTRDNTQNSNFPQGELGIAASAPVPVLTGAEWSVTGKTVQKPANNGRNVEVKLYALFWKSQTRRKGAAVKVPKDCITTAELVATWLRQQDPDAVGQVKTPPVIQAATQQTQVQPGDILLHVHRSTLGEFHAAPVIAKDGDDVVTMESDYSEKAIGITPPIFDMYEGPAGVPQSFAEIQTDNADMGDIEQTYVISFSDNAARSTGAATLWAGIETYQELTEPAKKAAERIKDAIKEALQVPPTVGAIKRQKTKSKRVTP